MNFKTVNSGAITFLIVSVNVIIRVMTLALIKRTKQNLEDQQVSYIMTTIFFSQYINTGWILMIASADFTNTPLSFLGIKNQFSDFSTDWYDVIGFQI
jgi:uncharacterized membrane protein